MRDIELRVRRESEGRKAQNAEVLRDVTFERGQSPEKVQETLLAAYQAHGYEPPSDFSRWSRFIAAGTARRGTRTPRMLFEAVSGLRALRRWTPGPAADEPPPAPARSSDDDQDAHNRSEVRKLGRATAVYGFVAAATATGAYLTSGVLSVLLAVVAALFAAITAWMVFWYVGLSTLTRVRPERRPR